MDDTAMKHFLIALFWLLFWLIPVEAANRFAVCTVTCTWDASDTTMWSGSSGGATGSSVPGAADTVTLDAATCVGGVTCTITVNTTVNVISIAMGTCTATTAGCILDFSVNNNNVTVQTFAATGTGTRTLKMGSGTFTVTLATGGQTPWNIGTSTNMTLTAGTSTIILSGSSATSFVGFAGGGLTYGTLSFPAATNRGGMSVSGSNTFANFSIGAPQVVYFSSGVNTTITNAFTWTGTPANPIIIMSNSNTAISTITVTSGAPTLTWGAVKAMTFTGGATFTATNSFDMGINTGITITPPSTSGGIIGGWLLKRDLYHDNDNTPMWLEKVA